jgi:hypothetical protein
MNDITQGIVILHPDGMTFRRRKNSDAESRGQPSLRGSGQPVSGQPRSGPPRSGQPQTHDQSSQHGSDQPRRERPRKNAPLSKQAKKRDYGTSPSSEEDKKLLKHEEHETPDR